jgi:hypothetical protein
METKLINNEEPLHTEQIQDIIGTPPRWLYRWGITFVLTIALICIFISSVINYPEVVKTQLKILSTSLPNGISFKESVRLIKILVPNDTPVKKGDDLAIIENLTGKAAIKAPMNGKLTYAGVIHEEEQLAAGRNIFFISIGNGNFYGEMFIPQNEANKVKTGQTVLVRLRNAVDEKQSELIGTIRYITDDQFKNGRYFAEVDFNVPKDVNKDDHAFLRSGIIADAEIITARATLFQRLIRSLTKGIK